METPGPFLRLSIILLLLILMTEGCGGGGPSSGGEDTGKTVSLAWDAPTQNTDGSPLTDLAGYRVFYGTSSGNYSKSVYVGDTITCVISNLSSGTTYYFVVTAYDTSGNESDYSNEVAKTTS